LTNVSLLHLSREILVSHYWKQQVHTGSRYRGIARYLISTVFVVAMDDERRAAIVMLGRT
jgi:hypothetical protein